MVFGLFKKSRSRSVSDDPWTFQHLGDYWHVLNWMNQQFRAGQPQVALDRYFHKLTDIIYESLDRYPQLLEQLDRKAGGVYTRPGLAAHCGVRLPPNTTLFENMMGHAKMARQFLDRIASHRGDAFRATWEAVIENNSTYVQLLSKLVQDFGNFELMIVQLPPLQFPENPGVQPLLADMFDINKRLVRLLELVREVHAAWKKGGVCVGFFETNTDMGLLLKQMIVEYMLESDPHRIANKQFHAERLGRPAEKYRFHRAAEAFRQLSEITYGSGPKRIPTPLRRYVDLQVPKSLPSICTDLKRMKWMLREVFNNSIAATSNMMRTDDGRVVTPIAKHDVANPPYAISLRAETFREKVSWFKSEPWIRLTISDEGIGMEPYIRRHAHLWAFSKRRAEFGTRSKAASKALIIGGKGMGLAFSESLVRQHGGHLSVSSHEGQGTRVTIELPTQMPFVDGVPMAA